MAEGGRTIEATDIRLASKRTVGGNNYLALKSVGRLRVGVMWKYGERC